MLTKEDRADILELVNTLLNPDDPMDEEATQAVLRALKEIVEQRNESAPDFAVICDRWEV